MEWRDALAQTFLAEVQSFGEDVLFRGETIPASVGQSEANKSLELSGYYEEQSLNLVIPLTEYSLLGSDPKVNETIIIREQGFRIDSVEKREDAIELNVEKIAGFRYIDPTPGQIGDNQQPLAPTIIFIGTGRRSNPPSNITIDRSPIEPSGILLDRSPRIPSQFFAISNPLAPSNLLVSASSIPLAPSNILLDTTPLIPSNVLLDTKPLAPSNLVLDKSPLIPSNLSLETTPLAPGNLSLETTPLAPSNLSLETIPLAPSNLTLDTTPLAPSNLTIDKNPLAPSNLTLARNPITPSNISVGASWTPENSTAIQGWWDASDSTTITTSGSEVTQWSDKSGNGLNLAPVTGATGPTTNTITQNSLNVLDFEDDCLENNNFTHNISNPIFLAFIVELDAVFTDQYFLWAGTTSSTDRCGIRKRPTDSVEIFGKTAGGANTFVGFGAPTKGSFQLLIAKINGSNGAAFLNGTLTDSGNTGADNLNTFNLGHAEGETQNFVGKYAEVVAFTDSNDRQKIEGYLAHKWGLEGNLPLTHPYKTLLPTI